MAITGPASFVPTTNLFLAHWAAADEALGASGPMVLKGGVGQSDLEALRDELQLKRAGVEAARNGREEARASLEQTKAQLLLWLNRFKLKIAAVAVSPAWAELLPNAFQQGDGMAKVIAPLDDVADVWRRYEEGLLEVLTLIGGTTLADFNAALANLKVFYSAYSNADIGLSLARLEREETQEKIRPVLVNYRERVAAEFAAGSPILGSLPRYSPLPGHTPEPVVASGVYDAGTNTAELSWTESTDANLVEYEVRGVAGEEYDADDESVIANVPAGAERAWAGTFGLGVPGAAACFRVYVMTSTGNERASNTVSLMRPL